MKKHLLWISAVALAMAMAGCTSDPGSEGPVEPDAPATPTGTQLTALKTDMSRILTPEQVSAYMASLSGKLRVAASRTNFDESDKPTIPADVDSYPEFSEWKEGNFRLLGGKTYDFNDLNNIAGKTVNIYITEPNVVINNFPNNNNSSGCSVNIIIAEGGSLQVNGDIRYMNIYCLGELYFSPYSTWVRVSNATVVNYSQQELPSKLNLTLGNGSGTYGTFRWNGKATLGSFSTTQGTFTAEFGDELVIEQNMSNDQGNLTFTCHNKATIGSNQANQNSLKGGTYLFEDDVTFENELQLADGTASFTCIGKATFKKKMTSSIDGTYTFNDVDFEEGFETTGHYITFECTGTANFNKTAKFESDGTYTFNEEVHFKELQIPNGHNRTIDLKDCSSIETLVQNGGSNGTHLNVSYYLYIQSWDLQGQGASIDIDLYDAVFALDGKCPDNATQSGANVISSGVKINGLHADGTAPGSEGYSGPTSGMFILGSLMCDNSNSDPYYQFHNFTGDLTIFGENTDAAPNLKIAKNGQLYNWGESYNLDNIGQKDITFANSGVAVKKEGAYIDGKADDPYGCRPTYGDPEVPPTPEPPTGTWVTPPGHKYSATSIDFGPNNAVYVSWHSNRKKDDDPFEDDHDHGTNVGSDGSEPSLDGSDDWGGIIDLMTVVKNNDTFTINDFNTYEQHEFKYNHVKYFNNTLYLASTSYSVGAALHVVPINGTTASTSDSYRINLTGNSANCVEVVNEDTESGAELVTISGRTKGGVNWFPIGETKSQEGKSISAPINNFAGKYVFKTSENIVTLNNTSNATVTYYDFNGAMKGSWNTGYSLEPVDGKNVCIVDNDGNVYVCCGRQGFHVFDKSGNEKGGHYLSANGCALEEGSGKTGYAYVATGGGLAIYDLKKTDSNGNFVLVVYLKYTGSYFNSRPQNEKTKENLAKESSNFVRVRDGVAYVAYGMYGLRIMDIDPFLTYYEQYGKN